MLDRDMKPREVIYNPSTIFGLEGIIEKLTKSVVRGCMSCIFRSSAQHRWLFLILKRRYTSRTVNCAEVASAAPTKPHEREGSFPFPEKGVLESRFRSYMRRDETHPRKLTAAEK
jgi:hypothetical protein